MKTLVIDIGSRAIRNLWIQPNGSGKLLPDPDYSLHQTANSNEDNFTLSRVSLSPDGPYIGWSCPIDTNQNVWQVNLSQLRHQEKIINEWCGEWLLALVFRKLGLNAEL
jgi:hypothetical protein